MPQTRRKSASAAKKSPKKAARTSPLGTLPEWNLDDLYPGIDSPAASTFAQSWAAFRVCSASFARTSDNGKTRP